MSLISSLYTGVSGLQTFGASMQVIGNNIANVSTIGFKSARTEFSALFSEAVNSGGGNVGRGVIVENVSTSFAQGAFNNSDRLTDLAIDGEGFFILSDGLDTVYTRNGQFTLDNQGFLVSASGLRVQGDVFNITGQSLGQGDLQLSTSTAPPRATSDGAGGAGVVIEANLDSGAEIPADPFDVTSSATAETTSNFSTSLTVYDSLGNSHTTTVYFRKAVEAPGPPPTNSWEWFATVDGAEVTDVGATDGVPFITTRGRLIFNSDGTLQTSEQGVDVTGTPVADPGFNFTGGAAPAQDIGFSFGDAIDDGGSGLDGSTQFASPSVVELQTQDGFGAGSLTSISIDANGSITGFFNNGQARTIGRILLADFPNIQGLAQVAGGMFRETPSSGLPQVGSPSVGGFGSISSFSLELSNVDLANEFVNLVTTQRAFQANTRIISTVDQLLADVVNIIR